MKHSIVTLCGSTSFKPEFERLERKLTLLGCVVLSLGIFSKYDNIPVADEDLDVLINVHFRKIELAETIFIVCPNGYIGKHTKKEIQYAESLGKEIYYVYDI